MNFIKKMQLIGKFKKGRILPIDELPDQQDRDEFLVEYSTKNNIPILISRQERWNDLKYINPNVELHRFARNFTIEIKDLDFPNGVLIDESVDIEMITWVKEKGFKISGGFS